MNSKVLATLSLVVAVTAGVALAQPHRIMVHGGGPGGPEGAEMHSCEAPDFLNLTADQKAQWDALHADLKKSVEPLFAQQRAAHDALHTALESANPDPTALGQQLLAIHAIERQIKSAHDAVEAKVAAILTPEQKLKLDALKSVHGCPRMPN